MARDFKKRNSPRDFRSQLDRIYNLRGRKPIDLYKIERRRRSGKRIFILILLMILILVLAASLVGFLIFNRTSRYGGQGIELKVIAPEEVRAGDSVEYLINYYNQEQLDIAQAELFIHYPEGFSFKSASLEPAEGKQDIWQLGTIRQGGNGQLKINGSLIGEKDETKTITASITYRPINFNADFTKTVSATSKIGESIFEMEIIAPNRLSIGKEIVYEVKYKNSSQETIPKLELRTKYPEGFIFKESSPEPINEERNVWQILNFGPGEENTLKIKGEINGEPNQDREIKMELGVVDQAGQFLSQLERSVNIRLVGSQLTLNLLINDLQLVSRADWGETLNYKIQYANENGNTLKDVVLEATLESNVLDWTTLKDSYNGRLSNQTITWDKESMPELAEIKPSSNGTISFSIKTFATAPAGSGSYQILSSLKASGKELVPEGDGFKELDFNTESNQVTTKLNTRLILHAEGRYFDEEFIQLGSGPLPPKAGQATSYVIIWDLSNSINEVSEVVVSTTLENNVNWVGEAQATAGHPLEYNSQTREITWRLDNLPAGAGSAYEAPQATFKISVTPTRSDVGKVLNLTKNTLLSAKDNFTGATISLADSPITTALENDLGSQGKGEVVE